MTDTKKVLKWVGLGCGGLILLGAIGVTACVLLIKGATDEPADRSHLFFANLRENNVAAAHAMMTPEYQATHPLPVFQQSLAALPVLVAQADSTFSSRSVQNSNATMSGFLTAPQGNVPVTVTLTHRGGVWHITSVNAAGQLMQ